MNTTKSIALLVLTLAATEPARAQSGAWPSTVDDLVLEPLAGEWYEVASYGSRTRRPCTADVRFQWVPRNQSTVDVQQVCTTASGSQSRTGKLRVPPDAHRGRLSASFAPALLSWLPAAWSDYWMVASGDQQRWLLIGDRRRSRLAVLSRVAALDEASLAEAIHQGRRQGFDVDRLVAVPHQSGGLRPTR